MEFKSTVNEADHKKYDVLIYCKRENEKGFQVLVEMNYKDGDKYIIVMPVGELSIVLKPGEYDEIIEEAKNALVKYLYKQLKEVAPVFWLEQIECIIVEENNDKADYLVNQIYDVKHNAIKRTTLIFEILFFSDGIKKYEDVWILSENAPSSAKKVKINYPVTVTIR